MYILAQKLLFADTAEQVSQVIRPYWSKELGGLARCVQAQDDMLEIIPTGSSKGKGVSVLLENLGVHPDDVRTVYPLEVVDTFRNVFA